MAAADGLVKAALNSAAGLRQALQARFDYISPSANDADTPMNERKPGIGMSTQRKGGGLGYSWNHLEPLVGDFAGVPPPFGVRGGRVVRGGGGDRGSGRGRPVPARSGADGHRGEPVVR